MYFGPERATRAAEPESTITQVAFHRQPVSCSISEVLSARGSQRALISERRSMPCLRQPISKSSKRVPSSNDASAISSTMVRSTSPVSTVSSRRSVASMKQLLPLKLQASRPRSKIDLASWLDSTVQNLRPPVASNLEKKRSKEIIAHSPIPRMSLSHEARLSRKLALDVYRDTPINSGPGSPILSRTCFSDEEPCYYCSPRSSVCDELCIVSDYENADTSSPCTQESLINYTDTIEMGRDRSIETSTTSFVSSRISRSSTGYHAEHVPPDEATWMKSCLRSRIGGGPQGEESGDGIFEFREEQNPFQAWLGSASSCSSSSFISDEVLDALATKLAPAKAHVVELNKVLQELPICTGSPISNLQVQPTTPYRVLRKRSKSVKYPMATSKKGASDDESIGPRQYQKSINESSSLPDQEQSHSVHKMSPSPAARKSFSICGELLAEHQCPDTESDTIESSRTIVASIYDAVQGFPQQMLFLDTPCVADIRHQNYLARRATDHQIFCNPSSSSPTYALPFDRLTSPKRRQRTATNFFTPFLRATTRKSTFLQMKLTPSYTNRPPSSVSTSMRSLASQPDIPPPKLSIFRQIFPNTQDWWRSVLYAHLIAFNYVRENTSLGRNTHDFPSKACRTLGISYGHSSGATPSPDPRTRLAELEETLISCINWITNCMEGSSNAQKDFRKIDDDYGRDRVLVRALAQIVKVCESSGCREANMPQVR